MGLSEQKSGNREGKDIDFLFLILIFDAVIISSVVIYLVIDHYMSREPDMSFILDKFNPDAITFTYNTALAHYTISPINKPSGSDFAARVSTNKPVDVYLTTFLNCVNTEDINKLDAHIVHKDVTDVLLKATSYPELLHSSQLCLIIYNREKKELEIVLYTYPVNVIKNLP